MNRLIPKELIPDSLWSNRILHLPPQLISSWKMLLDKYGLRDKAMQPAPKGFEGGVSKEDTDNHLAWRFSGSSARVMLPILDPLEDLGNIPSVFTRIFSGNRVFLADLPCGSGAASMSILSVFCELRKKGRIPRMPLHIVIVGGEISEYARAYADEALGSLIAELEDQAITVEFETIDWDVCDRFSNADLIRHLTLKSQSCMAKLLILANFSGFLQKQGKWKEAERQIDELFRHSRERNSTALWIEPRMNTVTQSGGFMPRLVEWFQRRFSALVAERDEDDEGLDFAMSAVRVKHPLIEGTFRTSLAVKRFDLPLKRKS